MNSECFNCTECKQNLFSKGGYRELGGVAYCGECANKRQGLINADKATTRFSAAQQSAKKCRICWSVIEGRFRKCGDFTYHFDCFKYALNATSFALFRLFAFLYSHLFKLTTDAKTAVLPL